ARVEFTVVGKLDLDLASLNHHMLVSQNVAVRADYDPRTQALLGLSLLEGGEEVAKEVVEEWVATEGISASRDFLGSNDTDHRRARLFSSDYDRAAAAHVLGKSRERQGER